MDTDTKLRIYLDTTIPNYLFAPTRPDREETTWRLWERCIAGEYEIFLSDIFFEELNKCYQPKLGKMYEQLNLIVFERLRVSDEVKILASEYISEGAFTDGSYNDSLHVAYATARHCDNVLSWNFHQTRLWTTDIVKKVNANNRYNDIDIIQPDVFLEEGGK